MLTLVKEVQSGVLLRKLAWRCPRHGDEAFTVVARSASHPALWLALGQLSTEEQVDQLLELLPREPASLVDLVENGCGLVGLEYGVLTSQLSVLEAQVVSWEGSPPWMLQVEPAAVWAVRGHVFGNDLNRVRLALLALRSYDVGVMDRPVPPAVIAGIGGL